MVKSQRATLTVWLTHCLSVHPTCPIGGPEYFGSPTNHVVFWYETPSEAIVAANDHPTKASSDAQIKSEIGLLKKVRNFRTLGSYPLSIYIVSSVP